MQKSSPRHRQTPKRCYHNREISWLLGEEKGYYERENKNKTKTKQIAFLLEPQKIRNGNDKYSRKPEAMILALCCKQKLLRVQALLQYERQKKLFSTISTGQQQKEATCLPPSLHQGILRDQIAEARYVQRRWGKRRLLTGELKKYDFSSEVFPRSAK